ncbi:uncharacterized protein LOC128549824 [Mercenaria mercenaria]|uniref:uncharacterized protein LOC128549824 n=1 Tax=Mercenaria mercenaria TaxID=6596 RepID=UPI00234F140B|nr:uncharacterized protein LOC128549824 [Mercenaria mercenaria]
MAAKLYSHKLSKSKYKNWIKAGLGVLYTKEGIEPFVYDEIEQFQQKCLSDICNSNGLPAGTKCSSCCTENVVVCPTDRICNVGRGKCSFHRNTATQYLRSGCPKKICHNFKSEIQKAHRFHGPSFKNTDATHWCKNPWEVAKCFMPPDGYKDATSATDTDLNGINSVIINLKAFQLKIQDDLSKKNNIVEKARQVGNAVRHSSYLGVEDGDLQQYFSTLQSLLSDPKCLAGQTYSRNAVKKLSELEDETLVIGIHDIRKLLDDVFNAAQGELRIEKDENKKEAGKQKLELIRITMKSIRDFEKQEKMSMSDLEKILQSAVDEIEKQTKTTIRKKQSTKMEHQHKAKDLDAIPSDVELDKIGQAIGRNWELLGPHLGLATTMIDRIKMDYHTSSTRIYRMLFIWRQDKGENATKRNLITAFGKQPSVNIDWNSLGRSFPDALKLKPRDTRQSFFDAPKHKPSLKRQPFPTAPKYKPRENKGADKNPGLKAEEQAYNRRKEAGFPFSSRFGLTVDYTDCVLLDLAGLPFSSRFDLIVDSIDCVLLDSAEFPYSSRFGLTVDCTDCVLLESIGYPFSSRFECIDCV